MTNQPEISTGQKLGIAASLIAFTAIGGFFGFLADQTVSLVSVPDSTRRIILITAGAAFVLAVTLILMKRGAITARERIESTGGTVSDMSFFSLAYLGATDSGHSIGSGSESHSFGGGGFDGFGHTGGFDSGGGGFDGGGSF